MITIHKIWDLSPIERDKRCVVRTLDEMIKIYQEKEPHRTVTARKIANRILLKCEQEMRT